MALKNAAQSASMAAIVLGVEPPFDAAAVVEGAEVGGAVVDAAVVGGDVDGEVVELDEPLWPQPAVAMAMRAVVAEATNT